MKSNIIEQRANHKKLSNEELVALIQSGEDEHIPQLWNQVVKFIRYRADQHLHHYPLHFREFKDDMINQSYFYFLKAIDGYKPDTGKFTTYLDYYLKNAFNEILQGITSRTQNEPLNNYKSLDQPIKNSNGEDDYTLGEMLIDVESEAYYRNVEDKDFWIYVNGVLQEAINEIDGLPHDILHSMLDHREGLKATILRLGGSEEEYFLYHNAYRKGMKVLRQKVCRYAKAKQDIALEEFIYYRTGAGTWRRNLFTSSVEQAVIKHDELQRRPKDFATMLKEHGGLPR